jgi:tRNA nucleotidyltransferase/poly(A) polymerase
MEIHDHGVSAQQMWRLHSCFTALPERMWKESEAILANKYSAQSMQYQFEYGDWKLVNQLVLTQ